MSGQVKHTVIDLRNTPGIRPDEAFEQWEAAISDAYVPLAALPGDRDEFRGYLTYSEFEGLEVSTVGGTGQQVRRTRRLIGQSDERYLLASVGISGSGRLQQDGRIAELTPGAMILYDSTRPYSWQLDDDWEQVVVQLPIAPILEQTGLLADEVRTAVRMAGDSAAGVVGRFFRGIADLQRTDPDEAASLAAHGAGLLASAVLLSMGTVPRDRPAQALTRQQVLSYLRSRYTDPDLTVEQVVRACMVSRRTLYRLFEDSTGGVGTILRRLRVDHARGLLRANAFRPLSSIATASGFATDRHFFRSFKQETGMTPGEYRVHYAERSGLTEHRLAQIVTDTARSDSAVGG